MGDTTLMGLANIEEALHLHKVLDIYLAPFGQRINEEKYSNFLFNTLRLI